MKWGSRYLSSSTLMVVLFYSMPVFCLGPFTGSTVAQLKPGPTLTLTKVIHGGLPADSPASVDRLVKKGTSKEWTTYCVGFAQQQVEFQVIEDLENHRIALVTRDQTLMRTTLYEPSTDQLAHYQLLLEDYKKVSKLNQQLADRIHNELKNIEKKVKFEKWYLNGEIRFRCSGSTVSLNNREADHTGLLLERIHGVFPQFVSLDSMINWHWLEPIKPKEKLGYLLHGKYFEGLHLPESKSLNNEGEDGALQHPGHFTRREFQYTTFYDINRSLVRERSINTIDLKRVWPVYVNRDSGEKESIIWFDFQRKLGRCIIKFNGNKIMAIHIIDPFGSILTSGPDFKFAFCYPTQFKTQNILDALINYNFKAKDVKTQYNYLQFDNSKGSILQPEKWEAFFDLKDVNDGDSSIIPGAMVRRFARSFQLLPKP